MNSRSVLIVGLGQIGMGYDLGLPPQNVLSHARAFQNCPGFRVIGGVDPDPKERRLIRFTLRNLMKAWK